ncbi:MAG: hypothetical protein QM811_31980 [Pirellulales bacterium]
MAEAPLAKGLAANGDSKPVAEAVASEGEGRAAAPQPFASRPQPGS